MDELERIVAYWETPEVLIENIKNLARNNVINRLIDEETLRVGMDAYVMLKEQQSEKLREITRWQVELEQAQTEFAAASAQRESAFRAFEQAQEEEERKKLAYEATEANQAQIDAEIRLKHRKYMLDQAIERLERIHVALQLLGVKEKKTWINLN